MTDELLHGAGAAHAHVQESWAPIVIDERTLEEWGKLPPSEPTPSPSRHTEHDKPKHDEHHRTSRFANRPI